MKKKILSVIVLVYFLLSVSYAQEAKPTKGKPTNQKNQVKIQNPSEAELPPIVLILGKEKESFQKVFINQAKTDQLVNLTLVIFDKNGTEGLNFVTYGLPKSARFDFQKDQNVKNKATATLSWTPTKTDIGFWTIVVEVTNTKGISSRMSLSYDVK